MLKTRTLWVEIRQIPHRKVSADYINGINILDDGAPVYPATDYIKAWAGEFPREEDHGSQLDNIRAAFDGQPGSELHRLDNVAVSLGIAMYPMRNLGIGDVVIRKWRGARGAGLADMLGPSGWLPITPFPYHWE